jgi:hypothetical protein
MVPAHLFGLFVPGVFGLFVPGVFERDMNVEPVMSLNVLSFKPA